MDTTRLSTARAFLAQASTNAAKAQHGLLDIHFKGGDPKNVLTQVDLANNQLAADMLAPFLAEGDILVGEESIETAYPGTPEAVLGQHRGGVWVLDPVDGTLAFSERKDSWGVMLAYYHNGTPLFAGVSMPSFGKYLEISPQGVSLVGEGNAPLPVVSSLPCGSGTVANISLRAPSLIPRAQNAGYVHVVAPSAAEMTINLAMGTSGLLALPSKAGFWDIAPAMMLAAQMSYVAFFENAPQTLLAVGPHLFRPDWQLADTLVITSDETRRVLFP